jgi:methyl-accepting chemotaxis protein
VSGEMEKLNEIAVKVGRMEATQEAQAEAVGKMANSVDRLVDKLDRSDDVAREAEQRARSAHHRIDESNKRMDEVASDIKWLWRTVITAIITGAIGGAITLLWKGVGS